MLGTDVWLPLVADDRCVLQAVQVRLGQPLVVGVLRPRARDNRVPRVSPIDRVVQRISLLSRVSLGWLRGLGLIVLVRAVVQFQEALLPVDQLLEAVLLGIVHLDLRVRSPLLVDHVVLY